MGEKMNERFYYEFSDHDYYALIVVTKEDDELNFEPHIEAAKIYVNVVGGETVKEVLSEAHPNLRTKEFAFEKFMRGGGNEGMKIEDLIYQFDETMNDALLVDSAFL